MRELFRNYALRNDIIKYLALPKAGFEKIKDPRSCPRYPLPEVFTEMLKALITGAKSLKDIEHKMQIEKFFKISCHDSCLGKIISQIPESEVKHLMEILQRQYNAYGKGGLTRVRLRDGKEIKVRHFDGTYFLGHYFSYAVSGGEVKPILGLKACSGIAEESSTTKLLEQELDQINALSEAEPFTIMDTYDGKYLCYEFMKKKHEEKKYFFIRIREDDARNLELIDFLETFRKSKDPYMRGAIDEERGEDYDRKIRYIVSYTRDTPKKLGFPIIIAHIHKEPLTSVRINQGNEEMRDVYIVSNFWNLSPEDIYKISMSHWEVETTFRSLKEQFVSSRTWMKSRVAALIWALLIAIAYNIVIFFSFKFHLKTNDKVKRTNNHIRDILRCIISSMRKTLNKILYDKDKQKEKEACLSCAGI